MRPARIGRRLFAGHSLARSGIGLVAQLAVRVVDRLEQAGEAGCLIHRPQALKCRPEQVDFAPRQQAHGYDAIICHDTNNARNRLKCL